MRRAGHARSSVRHVEHLQRGREQVAAELKELEQIEPSEAHPYDGYVLDYGLEQNRSFLKWVDRVLDELQGASQAARSPATRDRS